MHCTCIALCTGINDHCATTLGERFEFEEYYDQNYDRGDYESRR